MRAAFAKGERKALAVSPSICWYRLTRGVYLPDALEFLANGIIGIGAREHGVLCLPVGAVAPGQESEIRQGHETRHVGVVHDVLAAVAVCLVGEYAVGRLGVMEDGVADGACVLACLAGDLVELAGGVEQVGYVAELYG